MKFEVKDILMGLIKKGILMLYSGRNILRILPPLVISEEDITKVLHALDSILTEEEAETKCTRIKIDEKIIGYLKEYSRESFVDIGKKLKLIRISSKKTSKEPSRFWNHQEDLLWNLSEENIN